ncbi:MAG: nucleotidyltransferase family protein [Thermodesulfovibrionales bacterium]|nr:nucleotidyltransferase family protein [Thermodesulfovibrionales bacterium]
MGQIKQLLPLGERTVLTHCIYSIIQADIKETIVVISSQAKEIQKEISNLPINIAINPVQESEMAESVRIGFKAIKSYCSGILVYPSDHPLVQPDTIQKIISTHHNVPDRIIIPCYNNKKGHPTLFPFTALNALFSGCNLRDIIRTNYQKVFLLEVLDEGVILDIDTIKDYNEALKKISFISLKNNIS